MAESNNLYMKVELNGSGNIRLTRIGDTTERSKKDRAIIDFDFYGRYARYWLSNREDESPCPVNDIRCLETALKNKNFIQQPTEPI